MYSFHERERRLERRAIQRRAAVRAAAITQAAAWDALALREACEDLDDTLAINPYIAWREAGETVLLDLETGEIERL